MSVPSVRPFTPNHSINEVAFVISFAQVLSEDNLRRLKELEPQYTNDLPKVEEIQASGFQISSENGQMEPLPNRLASVSFKKFNDKGELKWALRAEQNILVVNCLDYSGGWKDVWPRVLSYLSIAIPTIISAENSIVSLGLQYIDKFIYEGDFDLYQSDAIFNLDSIYLNAQINASGPLWHLNQGWFSEVPSLPLIRTLNKLNITAALADKEHITTIEHNANMQFRNPFSNKKSLFDDKIAGDIAFKYYFDHLHLANKKVLSQLLNDERIKDIKLFGEMNG
jgi:uncharacterized protein (TIGR04255 family)